MGCTGKPPLLSTGTTALITQMASPIDVYGHNNNIYSEVFRDRVLAKFANDNIGHVCKNDATLKIIGNRFLAKANRKGPNLINDCARSVRTDMRRLAYVKVEMEKILGHDINATDIFKQKHIDTLNDAVTNYCQLESSEGSIKAGLKYALQFLLKRAAKSLKELKLKEEKDQEAEELSKWISAFHGETNVAFGDAVYQLNIDSQRNMRMPKSMPSQQSIQAVRDKSLSIIQSILDDPFDLPDHHTFVRLRNAVVTRLTLFNGKRGGEPARLTLTQYVEMSNDEWIQKDDPRYKDDEYIQTVTQNLKVTYQTVKGQHFVPVYFPRDIFDGCKMLASAEFREVGRVSTKNPFLFPSTRNTSDPGHVQGNQALDYMCQEAKLTKETAFTFTANRHRISTLYAALDVPEENRHLFFKGLGHSKTINETRYQAPEALRGIATVATNLHDIDLGK